MDFYVYATLPTSGASDFLITGLVRRGFQVGPVLEGEAHEMKGRVSNLCALHLQHPNPETGNKVPAAWCADVIRATLGEIGWFSLVVFEPSNGGIAWSGEHLKWTEPPGSPVPVPADSQLDKVGKVIGD